MDLWIHPEREDYKNNTISCEFLYNHILEKEIDSIEFYGFNHIFLQITPPGNVYLPTLNSKIYLKFNNRQDLSQTLEMVKKLIEI